MALLDNTLYSLPSDGLRHLGDQLRSLEERIQLLRSAGKLNEQALRHYYGEKRFEQVAESNAIEGSTLSVGETELAITKGMTITGHDPAYSRDAVSLHAAIVRLSELARDSAPTDIAQVSELHGLILGDRPGAGTFRNEEVRISGSEHRPPRTITEILDHMEKWEGWSTSSTTTTPVIRAAVLHAWLAHVHPFIDGNGRTARAVMNLELVRAGYPPIIIRRKDRDQYIDALQESDEGGNLAPFLDLVLRRCEDALRDLERAAERHAGYDATALRLRKRYENLLGVWEHAVPLLSSMIEEALVRMVGELGAVRFHRYEDRLGLDDFILLLQGSPTGNTWCFRMRVELPGFAPVTFLCWMGYRSGDMRAGSDLVSVAGPALFWSVPNPERYPQWLAARGLRAPFAKEMALPLPKADGWFILESAGGGVKRYPTSTLAERIATAILDAASGG